MRKFGKGEGLPGEDVWVMEVCGIYTVDEASMFEHDITRRLTSWVKLLTLDSSIIQNCEINTDVRTFY